MKLSKYEKKMRKAVKKIAKLLGKRGFTSGMLSSVSHCLDSDRFQVSPKGVYLRKLKKKMVVTVDGSGNPIYSRYGWQPTENLPLHLDVYQLRGDANAILHAHPPYLSALGLAVDKLDFSRLPVSLHVLGDKLQMEELHTQPEEVSPALSNALTNGNIVLLPGDGVLVVGRSLDHAFAQLEQMEHDAQVYVIAQSAGLLQ